MRLTTRLTVTLLVVVTVLLGARAVVNTVMATRLYSEDLRSDLAGMAEAIENHARQIEAQQGRDAALAYLGSVQGENDGMRVTWLSRDVVPAQLQRELEKNEHVTYESQHQVVVSNNVSAGTLDGVLQVVRSTAERDRYVRTTALFEAGTASILIILLALVSVVLNRRVVADRVTDLVERTRQIGRGDFAPGRPVYEEDELGQLARAINEAAAELRMAAERAVHEHEQRVMVEREVEVLEDVVDAMSDRLEDVEEARNTLEKQLQHADRLGSVGRLAAGVIHDLGTPLNVISGRAKMITSMPDNAGLVTENAQIIAEQSRRITKMVRRLLDFARGKPAKAVRIDLARTVEDTLALLEPIARKRNITLEAHSDAKKVHAIGDPVRIQQILNNLITNAMHASSDQSTVIVRTGVIETEGNGGGQAADPFAYLSVEDQGSGIPESELSRIFDAFYTTKPSGTGTGLGLSVSRDIVRSLGGRIEVKSEPGHGTIFTVYLPQKAKGKARGRGVAPSPRTEHRDQ